MVDTGLDPPEGAIFLGKDGKQLTTEGFAKRAAARRETETGPSAPGSAYRSPSGASTPRLSQSGLLLYHPVGERQRRRSAWVLPEALSAFRARLVEVFGPTVKVKLVEEGSD